MKRAVVLLGLLLLASGCSDDGTSGTQVPQTGTCSVGKALTDAAGELSCVLSDPQELPKGALLSGDWLSITETGAMPTPWLTDSPIDPVVADQFCVGQGKAYGHAVWRGIACTDIPSLPDDVRNEVLLTTFNAQPGAETVTSLQISAWDASCSAFCAAEGCAAPPGTENCVETCLYGTAELALEQGLACADAVSALRLCAGEANCAEDACDNAPVFEACSFEQTMAGPFVTPMAANFGVVEFGTSKTLKVTAGNNGSADAVLESVTLSGDGTFALTVPLDAPVTIAPGASWETQITFTPAGAGSASGTATFAFASGEMLAVTLTGTGTDEGCLKKALPQVADNATMLPAGSTVKLSAPNTMLDGTPIATWEWEIVDAPNGVVSVFTPSSSAQNPQFDADVVGEYTFRLRVRDQNGAEGCEPADVTVMVAPYEPIHVELLWLTEGDEDQGDQGPGAGSDVDLHVMRADAPADDERPDTNLDGAGDPWFELDSDCYFFNNFPNWGDPDPEVADDPKMVRDDTDGAGPEFIIAPVPEGSAGYRIGVHYFDDFANPQKSDPGYGQTIPWVNLWVDGVLVQTIEGPNLERYDFWDVGIWTPANGFVPTEDDSGGPVVTYYENYLP